MKKLMSLMIMSVLLTGCLRTDKNLLKVKDGKATWAGIAPVESRLWWRKNTAGLPKGKNPWEAFNQVVKPSVWHNPWAQENLTAYGVTPITPTKPIKYRFIRTIPDVRIIVVPENRFNEFYNKFLNKKYLKRHRLKKHPQQDKLFPPAKSSTPF